MYQKDTQGDADKIYTFITSQFGTPRQEIKKKRSFDPFFWEIDETVALSRTSPSERLNDAFVGANLYVERHYSKLVEDFTDFMPEEAVDANEEEEDDEEEPDF
jgi:hypothetical protein